MVSRAESSSAVSNELIATKKRLEEARHFLEQWVRNAQRTSFLQMETRAWLNNTIVSHDRREHLLMASDTLNKKVD